MEALDAAESSILLNDSAIIGLIRQLLVSEPPEESSQPDENLQLSGLIVEDAREEAGCMLWDMAALQEHAMVMAVSSARQRSLPSLR